MDKVAFYSMAESRDDLSFSHLTRSETREVTHSYHHYPAKFIPQLARELIECYTDKGQIIWDSYCGSGTLNVEAFRTYRHSIGTDLNPTAVLISRVKANPLDPEVLSKYTEELLEQISTGPVEEEAFYITQGALNGNIDSLRKWFSQDSLLGLTHVLWHIRAKKSGKKNLDFALCAFSSILKKSSYWLSSSVKSQIDPNRKPETPVLYFKRQLRTMEKANNLLYQENSANITSARIFRHNAKHRLPSIISPVDCIITSPPYLVSYDYSDIFRLSTHFLFPQPDYDQFRRAFVGTPLKRSGKKSVKIPALWRATVESINDPGIRRTVSEYYEDMSLYFRNAKYGIKKNGRLIMVVGDTKLREVEIPNAYLLADIATKNGWSLEETYARKIPVKILPTTRDITTGRFTNKANGNCSERYDKEYILVLRRLTA